MNNKIKRIETLSMEGDYFSIEESEYRGFILRTSKGSLNAFVLDREQIWELIQFLSEYKSALDQRDAEKKLKI